MNLFEVFTCKSFYSIHSPSVVPFLLRNQIWGSKSSVAYGLFEALLRKVRCVFRCQSLRGSYAKLIIAMALGLKSYDIVLGYDCCYPSIQGAPDAP